MNKKIKTTDLNLNVSTGTIFYVNIDIFRFLYDSETSFLIIEILDNEDYEFYESVCMIDLLERKTILNHKDLKIFALNWIFKNVEIVKEI
ncbi:ubiquitin [Clostridium botulinum]